MTRRLFLFQLLLLLAFIVLFARLFILTVVQGKHYREFSEGQRIRLRKIIAPRGIILDRSGKPLVKNTPVYKECMEECKVITREQALELEAESREAGLMIEIKREYPLREATAHLLGYLGEAGEEEVLSGRRELGDLVGRTGIEQEYEEILRGKDGGELIEVDAQGRTIRKIGEQKPLAGRDINLSVDADLQMAAWKALEGKTGAIVVQDAETSEVLALVSSPSFDPNLLISVGDKAGENKTEKIKEILDNAEKPFFNRAVAGLYPPGSTFKIITVAAGLEEGKIDAQTEIDDKGEIVVGAYRYANWYFTQYGKTEGLITLVRAIKRSTDTFFYKVGEWVGAEKLIKWSKFFGLGKVSGIDLPGEAAGFLPDPQKDEWFLGNTYHLSIGQGALGLTPLQVNRMTGVIASGGKLCEPHIKMEEQETRLSARQGGRVKNCQDVDLKPETLRLITEGMREVCSEGGTAFPFFDFKPQTACKTGTAEFGDPADRTHAWLTVFAPVDKPEIVVTVLVEGGGEGSYVAAPIAKKILEEWFGR